MRRKLVALALVVIFALTLVLSACDNNGMFRKNEERDIKQITATATYNDRITLINKGELNSSINQYINTLVQYYSYGITAAQYYSAISDMAKNYDSANENLGKSALFTLYCLDYLAESYKDNAEKYAAITAASTKGNTYNFKDSKDNARFYADRIAEIEAILTTEQLNDVRKALNEEFKTQFESYRDEVKKEIELAKKEKEKTAPENAVSINVTPPNKLIYEVGEDPDTKGFAVEAVYEDGSTFTLTEKDYTVSGFDSEKVAASVELTVAYGDLTASFEIEVIEARPTRPKKEAEEEEEEPYPVDDDNKMILLDKFDFSINRGDYEDRAEYSIDVEAMRRVTEDLKKGYKDYDYYYYKQLNSKVVDVCQELIQSAVKVKQSDMQSFYDTELNQQKEGYFSKEYEASTLESAPYNTIVHTVSDNGKGYFYVKHILFKFNTAQSDELTRYTSEKTGNDEALKALRERLARYIGVWLSNPIYDAEADSEDEDFVVDSDKKYLNDEAINVLAVIADIENDLDAIRTSPEFADEAERNRALVEKFDEWIYKANEDDGMFDTLEKGGLGYLVPPEGIDSGYVPEFEKLCHALVAQGVGAGDWCVTEYGIHYIVLTGFASDVAHDAEAEYVELPFDYVVNGLTYEKITSGDDYKVYTNDTNFYYIDKGTLAQYIYDTVSSNMKSDVFASFQKEFYNEYTSTNIDYYPKTYKNTVKEVQKNLNK